MGYPGRAPLPFPSRASGDPRNESIDMKHEQMDRKAKVWMVTRAPDGRLQDEFDPGLVARLNPGHSAKEIADVLVTAAGEMDLAESRLW